MRIVAIALIAIVLSPTLADQARLERAGQIAQQTPSAWRTLGLMEMQRAAGNRAAVREIAGRNVNGEGRSAFLEYACWRMMPAGVRSKCSCTRVSRASVESLPVPKVST